MRIVTRCLLPTPTDHLSIRSGIQPAELCLQKAKLFVADRRDLKHDHKLHGRLSYSSDNPNKE